MLWFVVTVLRRVHDPCLKCNLPKCLNNFLKALPLPNNALYCHILNFVFQFISVLLVLSCLPIPSEFAYALCLRIEADILLSQVAAPKKAKAEPKKAAATKKK